MRFRGSAVCAALVVGCAAPTPEEQPFREVFPAPYAPATASPARHAQRSAPVASPARQRTHCRSEIRRLRSLDPWSGAPAFERQRARILARAKAEPVLFLKEPRYDEGASAEVRLYRADLRRSPGSHALGRLRKYFSRRPEVARAVLLRDGYLYADTVGLAMGLVDHARLRHLFREPELVIHRGSERLRVVKGRRFYEYADGSERGERARLLLFDRVWVAGSDRGRPLHVGLRSLVATTGADRIHVQRITEQGILAELRYGGTWVPSVLSTTGAQASMRCELIPRGAEADVAHARDFVRRRHRVLQSLHAAIHSQVDEVLPFDEPKTEVGQQDGNLRPAWIWAYSHGWLNYRFNDDRYRVFDLQGRPLVPQVCIDFITDTLERASGTWWRERANEAVDRLAHRERITGNLDFESLGIANRRSVGVFVDFAWDNPQWFDAYDLPQQERIAFARRQRFFDYLHQHRDRFVPGDIVTIHGPRSDGEIAYHSFFIYDADPLTGMPTLLAANAGRPRTRTWEQELRAHPRRSIRSRLRPRLSWLESVVVTDRELLANEAVAGAIASG